MFEIDCLIGSGGMGEIYRGHGIQTGDQVAIKMIRSDVADTDAIMMMFRKEASALNTLFHEAIVRYYVFSVDPQLKRPYLVMEFVEGQSLSDRLKSGPLTYDDVRVLGARVASGLQVAHERGIIHRDISPDNIIITDHDMARAKIIDFGIARQMRSSDGTIIGDGFAGKFNYVSPEQLGLFGEVTERSDIYSLGLVLAEAIAGRALDMRGGSQYAIAEKRRTVPDLSHLDPRIVPLIGWMLQPEPAHRPGSMTEVAAWLRRGSGPTPGWAGHDLPDGTVAPLGTQVQRGPSAPPTPSWSPTPSGSPISRDGSSASQRPPGWGNASAQPQARGNASQPPGWASSGPSSGSARAPSAPPSSAAGASARPVGSGAESGAEGASQRPNSLAGGEAKGGGKGGLIAAAVAGLVVIGGGGAWFAMNQGTPTPPPETVTPTPPGGGSQTAQPTTETAPVRVGSNVTRITPDDASPTDVAPFLAAYRKPDCTLIQPIITADTMAVTEGFAVTSRPMQQFASDFKQRFGFDAELLMRTVTEAQCPALRFMAGLASSGDARQRPRLEITSQTIATGDFVAGEALPAGAGFVSIVMVQDDGLVRVLAKPTRAQGGSGASFVTRIERVVESGERPFLIVAIGSAQAYPALSSEQSLSLSAFLTRLTDEARAANDTLSATPQYLTVASR
jgi:serine/threonine-protein kinase